MSEKSHVGMLNCWICNQGAEILLDTKLRNVLDQNMGSMPDIICSECKSMSEDNDAIWLISVQDNQEPPTDPKEMWNPYRTGGCVLIKKEAVRASFKSLLQEDAAEKTIKLVDNNMYFYLPDAIWEVLGLPDHDEKIDNLPVVRNPEELDDE